jgi:hypothetical protein
MRAERPRRASFRGGMKRCDNEYIRRTRFTVAEVQPRQMMRPHGEEKGKGATPSRVSAVNRIASSASPVAAISKDHDVKVAVYNWQRRRWMSNATAQSFDPSRSESFSQRPTPLSRQTRFLISPQDTFTSCSFPLPTHPHTHTDLSPFIT